jgi:hypothetical protein
MPMRAPRFPEEMSRDPERPAPELTEDRKRQLNKVLEHQGKIDLDLDQDQLTRLRADEEERFWAGQGERRLETFERQTSLPHKAAWD